VRQVLDDAVAAIFNLIFIEKPKIGSEHINKADAHISGLCDTQTELVSKQIGCSEALAVLLRSQFHLAFSNYEREEISV
jgi:hypothetical protein